MKYRGSEELKENRKRKPSGRSSVRITYKQQAEGGRNVKTVFKLNDIQAIDEEKSGKDEKSTNQIPGTQKGGEITT